jgi:curved DNA-binding protein CbpA
VDLYKTLGVDRSAPAEVIEAAYRALAKKYHPDTNRTDPTAAARFRSIQLAYETLRDPSLRATWDRANPVVANRPAQASSLKPPPSSASSASPPNASSKAPPPPHGTYRWPTPDQPPTSPTDSNQRRNAALIGIVLLLIVGLAKNGGMFDTDAAGRTSTPTAQARVTSTPTSTKSPGPSPTPRHRPEATMTAARART